MTKDVLDSKQVSIPFGIKIVLGYIVFEFANQLSKVSNFVDTTSIANLAADAIGFASILIPVLLLYGIMKRKRWGRILTLVWSGLEVSFEISISVLAVLIKHIVPVSFTLLIEYACRLFVLAYVYHARDFFQGLPPGLR